MDLDNDNNNINSVDTKYKLVLETLWRRAELAPNEDIDALMQKIFQPPSNASFPKDSPLSNVFGPDGKDFSLQMKFSVRPFRSTCT